MFCRLYHPWYNTRVSTSPLVPTWALQLGLLLVLITTLACWREAERTRHAVVPGLIAVVGMICFSLLAAILIYRGASR